MEGRKKGQSGLFNLYVRCSALNTRNETVRKVSNKEVKIPDKRAGKGGGGKAALSLNRPRGRRKKRNETFYEIPRQSSKRTE